MRFVHRIALRASHAQRRALESLGIPLPKGLSLPGGGDPLLAFDVEEGHPEWATLARMFEEWHVSDVQHTEFERQELEGAQWLQLGAWLHGYPQPDEDRFGYREATYDLANFCPSCGIGLRQRAPFQMKSEPPWGRRSILQLTWIYDEVFVTPELWQRVFECAGIGARPVLNRRGVELKTVVQLDVQEIVALDATALSADRCGTCGRTKYRPVQRGPLPPLTRPPLAAMVRTEQYFGSGGQACQALLASQTIARELAVAEVRGAVWKPVAE